MLKARDAIPARVKSCSSNGCADKSAGLAAQGWRGPRVLPPPRGSRGPGGTARTPSGQRCPLPGQVPPARPGEPSPAGFPMDVSSRSPSSLSQDVICCPHATSRNSPAPHPPITPPPFTSPFSRLIPHQIPISWLLCIPPSIPSHSPPNPHLIAPRHPLVLTHHVPHHIL